MKTLILDNYDSFTYNLYQYLEELSGNVVVYRNDEVTLAELKKEKPTHIVISPGPGTVEKKEDFGVCSSVIKHFTGKIPLLGICLGHQGIARQFGGKITHAPSIVHGKTSEIQIVKVNPLFKEVPKKFKAMRYHSLMVDRSSIPDELEATAQTIDGIIMGIQHKKKPLFGLQFHPESFATPHGKKMLKNFLHL